MKVKHYRNKIFGTVLAAVLTITACIPPAITAEASEAKSSTSDISYENENNAVSDAAYAEFGLSTNSPEEFDPADTSHPMESYEPLEISELYVGDMNRADHWTGSFKVMEDVDTLNSSSLNFDNMDNRLVGKEYSFNEIYDDDKDPIEIQTHNSCAIDADGDGTDEILDTMFYVDRDKDELSCQDIRIYDLNEETNKWEAKKVCSYDLANDDSNTQDFVWSIEADTSKAYTAVAAGDYDNDGKDEAAVYVPSKVGNNTCVIIYDVKEDYSLIEKARIYADTFNSGDNKFNYEYENRYAPIVSLSTTSISGYDDLVVNISHPLRDDGDTNDYGHDSALGIYRFEDGKLVKKYTKSSMTFGGYRMRFCSAADTDLNGNGIGELAIGGYKNYDYSDLTDVGELSEDENCIWLLHWNEQTQSYEPVWDNPKLVAACDALTVDKNMMEPVAFASGAFHSGSQREQIFLEGNLFKSKGDTDNGSSEKDYLKNLEFVKEKELARDGDNDPFISTAVAATFSTSTGSTEQLVVLLGDHRSTDNDVVYYDIAWMWETSTGELRSEVTHDDYMDGCDEDDNGTFVSICALDADKDKMYVRYEGKEYGWSAPELYCIMQSLPYWEEVTYSLDYAGSTSYALSYGRSYGSETDRALGGGLQIGGSLTLGVGLAGNNLAGGRGAEASAMAKEVYNYSETHSVEDTFETIVYPGMDYAVLYAVPTVAYKYKVWVPEFTATKEFIESYKAQNDGTCPYTEGQTVPAGEEDFYVQNTLEPSFTCISLDKYNELAAKYKDANLKPIESSMLADKTIGDPTTYPENADELDQPLNIVEDSLFLSQVAEVRNEGTETVLTHSMEDTDATTTGYNVDVAFQSNLVASAEISLGLSVNADGHIGWSFGYSGAFLRMESSAKGMAFSSLFKHSVPGTPDAYNYKSQMAVFQIDNASYDTNDYPYVIGYTVTGNTTATPPKLPVDLHVFASTKEQVVLKWDHPEYRTAKSYEIYVKDNLGTPVSIGKTENPYFVVTDLEPDRNYEFAVKSYTGENQSGTPSVLSHWVSAATKPDSDNAPQFITQPKNAVAADSANLPTLQSEAVAGMEGASISYQWQVFTDANVWEDIEGATEKDYTPTSVLNDPTYYRVVATQKKGGNVQSIISKTAAIFLTEDDARIAHLLTADLTIESEDNIDCFLNSGTHFIPAGTKNLICKVQLKNENDSNLLPQNAEVTVVAVDEANNKISKTGTASKDGCAEIIFDEEFAEGTYTFYVEYYGDQEGYHYFLPIISDFYSVHPVTSYRILYHLDGGTKSPQNPSVLTCENGATKLHDVGKARYQLLGWYWDEALTDEIADRTLTPAILSEKADDEGNVHLYVKWEKLAEEDEEKPDDENPVLPDDGDEDPTLPDDGDEDLDVPDDGDDEPAIPDDGDEDLDVPDDNDDSTDSESVDTGDSVQIIPFVLLLMLSAAVIINKSKYYR